MSKLEICIIHLLLLGILVSSCSRGEESLFEPGTGGIRIGVDAELAQTRADVAEGSLDVDDFKVEIINSKGVIFKRWATYAEYKAQEGTAFVMNAGGPYTLRATYGDSTASGWDAWFFKGETSFEVLPQETVDVSTVCRMANVKVAVKYGADIRTDFTDYRTVVTSTRGRLEFDKEASEAGYMPVAPLTVNVELTDKDGNTWSFRNNSEVAAAPGDFITLNVNTEPMPKVEPELDLSIDYSTNDSTINVVLDVFMLPSDAPSISPDGFDAGTGILSYVESTVPEQADVSLNVPSGIVACTMTTNSAYLTGQLGWPEKVDFFNMDEGGIKATIDRYGLMYPEDMNGLTMAGIDFREVAGHLKYTGDEASDSHSFTIWVEDANGKTAEATYVLRPVEAEKNVSEIVPGDVWAARAYIELTTNGDPAQLYPEIKADGSEEWTRPAFTSSVSGNTNTVTVTGLEPATGYSVRAGYNNFSSGQTREFTTEEAQQVGNAGFEEWSAFTHTFTAVIPSRELEWYRPYADEASAWWDVNSRMTMNSYYSLVGSQNARVFMTAAYVSAEPYEGSRSAVLFTTHVSSTEYNTSAAGEIFIGRAKDGNGKDGGGTHESEGHAFGSRPSALSLAYRYEPYGSETYYVEVAVKAEDGSVIGSVTDKSGGASSIWSRRRIDLNYTDLTKKAASIYISIKSSSSDDPGYAGRQIVVADGKEYSGCNIGSILYVDDIELIYE